MLADVVKALGGVDSLRRHKTLHTKVQIVFRGLGMTGTAEHFAAAGDRALTLTTVPGLASTREGCDGSVCWSEDPINGTRVLAGAEAEQARIEAAWNPELRLKDLFDKLEVRNERDEDGAALECLVLTPKSSGAMTNCFDARTHLLVVQRQIHAGPQGDVPFTSRLRDWKMTNDIAVPYTTEVQAGPLTFIGTLTSIEMDVPVDPKRFAAPARGGVGSTRGKLKSSNGAPPATSKGPTKIQRSAE